MKKVQSTKNPNMYGEQLLPLKTIVHVIYIIHLLQSAVCSAPLPSVRALRFSNVCQLIARYATFLMCVTRSTLMNNLEPNLHT